MITTHSKTFESLQDLCDALNNLGRDIEGRGCESCQILDERTVAQFGFRLESYPTFGGETPAEPFVWSYDATHVMISAPDDNADGNWYRVVPREK